MKASLSEYIKELSGNELSTLEEIISKKYRKFMNFFSLVQDYSDDIVALTYNFTDQNTLDIDLSMKGSGKKDLREEIKEEMFALGYQVESKITAKKIKLVITYDESQLL